MSDQKRKANERDPDYDDLVDQQAKRQRVLEQDGRQAACRKINFLIKREFQREIIEKEKELQQIDLRLNEARLMMDRLRACVVASYYGRAHRSQSSVPSTSNFSSAKAPPPNIHPTVKRHIGKAPRDQRQADSPASQELESEMNENERGESQAPSQDLNELSTKVTLKPASLRSSPTLSSSPLPFTSLKLSKSSMIPAKYDDRRLRFKIKKKIVIGNVSRYIPVDQRELTDMSSHKWMIYVRGPKSEPNISGFVKKVWFFLHHSYKPNDHVEISVPPFHLTRRGWGEFPVRVQLHFVDPRNKKVDIIHHLKLDKTFTGLQKLGAETAVEVELERDMFESDDVDTFKISEVPNGQHLYIPSASSSSSLKQSSSTSSRLPKRPEGAVPSSLKSNSSAFQTLPSRSSSSVTGKSTSSSCSQPADDRRLETKAKNLRDNSIKNETLDGGAEYLEGREMETELKNAEESDQFDFSWLKTEVEEEEIIVGTVNDEVVLEDGLITDESRFERQHVDSQHLDNLTEDYNVTIKHETDDYEEVVTEDSGRDDSIEAWNLRDLKDTHQILDLDIKQEVVCDWIETGNTNCMVGDVRDAGDITLCNEEIEDGDREKENTQQHQDPFAKENFNLRIVSNDVKVSKLTDTVKQMFVDSGIVTPESSSSLLSSVKAHTSTSCLAFPETVNVASTSKVLSMGSQNVLPTDSSKNQSVSKQVRPVSLLTSSTLEKLRQQRQTQQQHLNDHDATPSPRKISILKTESLQEKSALSTSQLSVNQTPDTNQSLKQFTVINVADLHRKKSVSPAASVLPQPLTIKKVTLSSASTCTSTVSQARTTAQTCDSGKLLSPSNHVNPRQPEQNQQHYIVQLPPGQMLRSNESQQKSLLAGQKLLKINHGKIIHQAQDKQNKTSLLPSNIQKVQSGQKIVYLNTSSSSSSPLSHQIVTPSPNPSSVILPSTTNSKKQVSLLTGLVVNSHNDQATNQNAGIQIVSSNQIDSSVISSHEAAQSNLDDFMNINAPLNAGGISQNLSNDPGIVIVSRSSNPHLLIDQNTALSSVQPSTSLVQPPSSKISSGFSLLASSISSATTATSLIKRSGIHTTPNTVLAQTSSPNIMIAYPNMAIRAGNVASNLVNSTDIGSEQLDVKMSAIGRTKRGGQRFVKPAEAVIPAFASHDTAEERIRKQYEVLSAWKNNPLLYEIRASSVKKTNNLNDVIDGEVDDIPKLNVEDYPNLMGLTKAALKLHPLIQAGVNKLTHPYCADSLEQWRSWPLGKQRAAEWHRACFTLKYIKSCLGGASSFKGDNLYRTRQLVQWSRLHAFSPQRPVVHKPEPAEEPSDRMCNGVTDVSSSLPWIINETPQSFTNLSDLNPQLTGLSQPMSPTDAEVEIVHEELVENKMNVKEEVVCGEEEQCEDIEILHQSDGADFVDDWMRKRGIKFLPHVHEQNVAAGALYQATMEFAADVLRTAFSVCSQKNGSADSLTVRDVHKALSSLPEAAFCRNTYLGKEEEEESGGNSGR